MAKAFIRTITPMRVSNRPIILSSPVSCSISAAAQESRTSTSPLSDFFRLIVERVRLVANFPLPSSSFSDVPAPAPGAPGPPATKAASFMAEVSITSAPPSGAGVEGHCGGSESISSGMAGWSVTDKPAMADVPRNLGSPSSRLGVEGFHGPSGASCSPSAISTPATSSGPGKAEAGDVIGEVTGEVTGEAAGDIIFFNSSRWRSMARLSDCCCFSAARYISCCCVCAAR
mmetsp:Transcript_41907/g.97600  ORF Transcript_41907/g.97600 Transcript_41907/m.97600 type:complete len:230 (+) Transcript_41907:1342-2031(+)